MKRIVYVFFFALLVSSCAPDNDENFQNPDSNFYALSVGNQWVYKNYKYNNSTQAYDDTNVIDSVSIVGTEFINGNTYYKFRHFTTGNENGMTFCNPNGEQFELLRDSIGYLVWDNGKIKYANNDFSARTHTELGFATIYDQLVAADNEITVEAGTFESTYSQRYAIQSNGEQANAVDHFFYADGIGLVYDTSSLMSEDIPKIKRRLVSYLVQ
ncbi:hypothetical protein HNV08_13225 [Winogradskyella eckloniae]|uniref:hypothetical protein n=1 Tax=Winogradskyella eckloniae TaxID=1089306 RepID=UPI0015672C9F|nr:hypothetical protein [Winogradskyella eckloniae]NRD21012.1 hypothetical protein [Winogradskyella eckloniae]